ncbi:MAG: T9SS type A sorting domain-containing protein, partial [Mariniphaga sp.]|nr:T9SS type A sorting domain-containing protein [Mariniphaga sp.]
ISSGGGYTYLVDNNILQSGIIDASGGCWTTISNNTIINGRISDSSGGTAFNWDCEDPSCMVEDQFIENNTIFFEPSGDQEEDFAISIRSSSATIRGNKITCKGPASGMQLISGPPTHVIDNIISVEKQATYGILTDAGYGVVTRNTITGGKIGYSSRSGAVLFENNTITGSHWGFFSKGFEEVKNNTITNCTGHGMVLAGLRGPISENTITNNDSTGIWVLSSVDLGGGRYNGIGRNIIRGNGYYDMRISMNAVTPDTLFINNNAWDHETIEDILKYDILNESTGGKLLLDFNSIIAKPAIVQLSAPAVQSVLSVLPAQFLWQTATSAEKYRLQVSASPLFTAFLLDTLLTANSFTMDNLPNQSYYWRVQAVNLAGESDWSETWSFKTETATGITDFEKSNIEFLNAWPNPFTENITISYSVKFSGFVSLKMYNVPGNEIVNLVNQIQPQGKFNLQFNGSSLKPGLYFLNLITGESSQTIKIILSEH